MDKKIQAFEAKAKAAKEKAVATLTAKAHAAAQIALAKGIELSERQLAALRNAKQHLS